MVPSDLKYHLKQVYKLSNFRFQQEEIISEIIEKRAVAAFLPTGAGKTLLYQFPTTYNRIKTVVISPLIALIQDQYNRAQNLKITSFLMHGQLSKAENQKNMEGFLTNQMAILFLSPERWNSSVRAICEDRKLEIMLVIDEAHCMSTWGKSFRPDYKEITYKYNYFGFFKLLVLSATPTSDLMQLVRTQFQLDDISVFMGDLYRSNLAYAVKIVDDQLLFLSEVLSAIKEPAIIYVQNRKMVEKLAEFFNDKSIATSFFHAGLTVEEKNKQTKLFMEDKVKVMVATSAFGMGIDKPNIRYVLHLEMPSKVEDYLQESGRVGRDGKKSFAYLILEKSVYEQARRAPKILADMRESWIKSMRFYQHEFNPVIPKNNTAKKILLSVIGENRNLFKLENSDFQKDSVYQVKLISDHFIESQISPSVQDLLDLFLHFYTGKIYFEFAEVDLELMAEKSYLSIGDIKKSFTEAFETGFIQVKDTVQKPKLEFPLLWKMSSGEGLKVLATELSAKIKQLENWLDYSEEKSCLSHNLVMQLTHSKKEYHCGICSYCLNDKTEDIMDVDMEKMFNFMRRNMHKVSYPQLIHELSTNWEKSDQKKYPVATLNKMIQFALREKKIAELRTKDGTYFELKML